LASSMGGDRGEVVGQRGELRTTGEREVPLTVTFVALNIGARGGVPRYATALARAIDELSAGYASLRLSLLTTPRGAELADLRHLRVETARTRIALAPRGPSRILAEQLALRGQGSELLYFFDLSGPLLAPRRPFIATIHDFSFLHGYSRFRHAYRRLLTPWAVRRATKLVAISHFAKEEAIRLASARPDAIEVIHSGPGFVGSDSAATEPAPSDSGRPQLLYVGDLTASKNVGTIVRAYGHTSSAASLVLVGRPGEQWSELDELIRSSPRRPDITVLTDASDEDLERLYARAHALLLPSYYEGFGFTALEAMTRGCPVIESDIPALREVSGSGAMLLPPDDVHAWAAAMSRVTTDTAFREGLRSAGFETAARYSWKKTARYVLELLQRVNAVPATATP
jgi:glycosyltransferase involved in cell wall biosynthesis